MHKIIHVCTDRIAKGNSALEGAHIVTVSTTKINEQCGEVVSWIVEKLLHFNQWMQFAYTSLPICN